MEEYINQRELSVEIFIAGDGISYPQPGDIVKVHYNAFLPDGTEFDSTRKRNKPFQFKLGNEQVIIGLDEGVAQLSLGETARIVIPANKAYGLRGFPGLIPPNTTLIFDLELIAIK